MRRKNLTSREEGDVRTKDLALLAFVIANGDEALSESDITTALDITRKLDVFPTMTDPQRRLIFALCRKIDPTGDGWEHEDGLTPAERNKDVPRGNEVDKPAVLQRLPLGPPGRGGGFK